MSRRRVVVVGGGFGGLALAKKLRRADVEVTLVDRMNHQLFQPLLYQVATGVLSAGDCATAIRAAVGRHENTTVLMAEVEDFDVSERQVVLAGGDRLDYDSLVLACGAQTSYFGSDQWAEVSCGLKTLADALQLRDRLYSAFEEAERATDDAAREAWMTFVIVGGGPTGVEVAGQIAVLAHHQLKRDFTRIDPSRARVIVLDAGERVLPVFSKGLSAKAAATLASFGVTVREGVRVTGIDEHGVTASVDGGSETIEARTVIWAAGVRAAPVAEALAAAAGASTDRGGRIEVGADLAIAGHPEISVIGDAASVKGSDGKPLPGLATVAIQQAHHVAQGIGGGRPGAAGPFRYFDKGALAVIGRGRAVGEVRGLRLSGLPAFVTYLGVHLYYLGGVLGRRLRVLNAWIFLGFGFAGSRVIEGSLGAVDRASDSVETRAGPG